MNHLNYRIAKDYMRETHAQAYRDYLARSLQPSFRECLAKMLTTFASRLERKTQAEGSDFAPEIKLAG